MPSNLLLVDGYNLIRRIYEAHPEPERDLSEVVTRSVSSLERALEVHEPSHACCVFEYHDPTWRHLLYPEYKQGRQPTPPGLLSGLGRFIEAFGLVGVKSVAVESYEADDVIATLAVIVADSGGDVVVLSTDKMYLQLLCDQIRVFDHFAGKFLTAEYVQDKFGVSPGRLTDYWAMTGDATNNIRGVKGIGPKSAVSLLEQYGNLSSVLADQSDGRLAVKVREQEHAALVARQLVTLKRDVQVGMNLRELRYYHGK
jgi:protein Xni